MNANQQQHQYYDYFHEWITRTGLNSYTAQYCLLDESLGFPFVENNILHKR